MNRIVTYAAASRSAAHYNGLQVLVLGFARQGAAAARFFLAQRARVTVSDLRTESELAGARQELDAFAAQLGAETGEEPSLRFVLGAHPAEMLERTDLLCLSGGVSPAIPIVEEAVRHGITLTNDALLTLQHCPVPIIGITGSAGKTTTTTLVGLMLQESGFTVHVGGNIGTPLLDRLDGIGSGDKVVMELSSFQLELFDRSPDIAAVLNITPNHLDRHPSMSHYAAAKTRILQYQAQGDTCILNADDPLTGAWLSSGRCQIGEGVGQPAVYFPLLAGRLGFSLSAPVIGGAFLSGDALIWRRPGLPDVIICRAGDLRLRGRHNGANVLAACCVAGAAGADVEAMSQVATTFGGVEHRLEPVRQRNGVLWVNDSIATAPERTVAALRAFEEPLVLLLGGRDKNLPWTECAAEVHARRPDGSPRVRHVFLFGEAAGLIGDALARHARQAGVRAIPSTTCAGLETAVDAAAKLAQPGDVVLLAPGGASFDAYADFAARGRHFRALVEALS
jgi:UDP-N-acetylmuramoylalanine--D-glutamate ligase